jgi:hypothetical protein
LKLNALTSNALSAGVAAVMMAGLGTLAASAQAAPQAPQHVPPSGVIGVSEEMLKPGFWIARTRAPEKLLLTSAAIAVRNARTLANDPALVNLSTLPATVTREQVAGWLHDAMASPPGQLVDRKGEPIAPAASEAAVGNVQSDAIPDSQPVRWGLSVRRAALRLLPTKLEGYASKDATDVDAFQGGILFPGEAVAIVHTSRDGLWAFVQTTQGPAWVARDDIAEGDRARVLGYGANGPFRVVTGDGVQTVFTPEAPEVSELKLDMGVRLPMADVRADQPVNGQGIYASWVLDLPVRTADGALAFKPALLRRTADTSADYLPLSRANLIRQAFKFLGERYGWGHTYNARDCSGFTSDVYRSLGLILPPNSGAQGRSPAFRHQLFTAADSHDARVRALKNAQVGDLVVVPGHVQMILGHIRGEPYVIQDVPFAVFPDGSGSLRWTKLNQVSVTPLLPLMADKNQTYADAMTSLVHVTAPD